MSLSINKQSVNEALVRQAEIQSIAKRSEADAKQQQVKHNLATQPIKRKNSEWRDTWLNIKASIYALF